MKCELKKPPEDFGHFSSIAPTTLLHLLASWFNGEYSLDERKTNIKASIYWVGQQVCLGFSEYWKIHI